MYTHIVNSLTFVLCVGSHGRAYVIRRAGEEYDEDKVVTYDTFNASQTVHFWTCFAASGVGDIYFFDDTLTSKLMIRIYKECLWHTARRLFPPNADWWLLYDNDKRHTADDTIQWLNENFVRRRIEFPPYSPDLNPIENLWPNLIARVDSHHAHTREDLQKIIQCEWQKTSPSLCAKLASSMPKRLQEVIDQQGHKTHY